MNDRVRLRLGSQERPVCGTETDRMLKNVSEEWGGVSQQEGPHNAKVTRWKWLSLIPVTDIMSIVAGA